MNQRPTLEYERPRRRWRWWHFLIILVALLTVALMISLVYDPLGLWDVQELKAPPRF